MTETPADTVVTQALSVEFVRKRSQMEGAVTRLKFAHRQVEIETALLVEYQRDMDMLADAILHSGGAIPPEDPKP